MNLPTSEEQEKMDILEKIKKAVLFSRSASFLLLFPSLTRFHFSFLFFRIPTWISPELIHAPCHATHKN
jgi:hypothetical protein